MRICILIAVIVVILTNDSCADERTNQNNLITTYDPGELPLGTPISPRLRNYGKITPDISDHYPEQYGRMSFEDQTSDRPIKFKDDAKEPGSTVTDETDTHFATNDVSFGDGEDSERKSRSLHKFKSESESRSKIKFESNNNEPGNFYDQEVDDDYDAPQSDTTQVVFEKDGKFREDDPGNSDDYQIDGETHKPIKFETHYDQPNSGTKNADYGKNSVAERVVFRDDSTQNQEPVRKKKRKPRRKLVSQRLPDNPAMASNSPYPGFGNLGYPNYPGSVVPSSVSPVPSTPDSLGLSYANSGYPKPYPGMAYPVYPPHPGSPYQPMGQGYGIYPASGYKRPSVNPNPGNSNTRYPSHEYAGPVASLPGPEYPYSQAYPVPGYAQAYPGDPSLQYPVQSQTSYRSGHPGVLQLGYQGGYGSSRRPQSLPQRAVSAVAEALTSIALYDDQQCVPKLLCEVAGGSASSSSMLLKATAGLQPLLTVLQAYNGVSSSPLFVFSRAAVTGVTSKGNPSACRHAYPQCPNDPEKLLNYLNNHNGGFFRFFGQPELSQQPHNLEQFYSYLSGQNNVQNQPQQNYGYLKPGGYGFQTENAYANSQKYGLYNREQNSYRNASNSESEIEARIQNNPDVNVLEDDNDLSAIEDNDRGPKWLFPDEGNKKQSNDKENFKKQGRPSRRSKTLKFPDDRSSDDRRPSKARDYVRKQKSIFFPGERYSLFKRPVYQTTTPVNPEEYVFDHKHNFYVKRPKVNNNDDVVYVVRGNGDPNHPEIVKVKPGQSVF